jgi:hypothetical protein
MANVSINAALLIEIDSIEDWIHSSRERLAALDVAPEDNIICVDKEGNFLISAPDFRAAESQNLYPVKVYRVFRTSEVELTSVKNHQVKANS